MSEAKIVPPPLLEAYKVPPFPAAGVPTEAEWEDALSWAKDKGMLDVDVSYAELSYGRVSSLALACFHYNQREAVFGGLPLPFPAR